MSQGLIVCAAPQADSGQYYRQLIASYRGVVIAADAGAEVCLAHGRVPDLLVGDLDSIGPAAIEEMSAAGVGIQSSPAVKDVTDLDLALDAALELGLTNVTVTAAWSGRLDHTLAAIGSVFSHHGLVIDVCDPGTSGWIIDAGSRDSVSLSGPGATFSLFSLDGTAIVTCRGARYSLDSATLGPLASRGVSNELLDTEALVIAERGRILVFSGVVAGIGPALFSPGAG
jgi:thiamine pyrophosphokinase